MPWHPENASARKRWAAIQAQWAKLGQRDFRERDFRELWAEPGPLWSEPPNESEAEESRQARPSPAPLAGPRPLRRRGKPQSSTGD